MRGRTGFKRAVIPLIVILIAAAAVISLYKLRVIPHRQCSGEDFGIAPYVSAVDMDGDGIDDQTDILQSVREYIATKPKYKSKYYDTGYPDDGYGVCTDVAAQGLKGAGYDLMELVNADVLTNRDNYNIEAVDKNIDFRRVRNLAVYFKNNCIALTTDLSRIEE